MISSLVFVVILGVLLSFVETYVPMSPPVKAVLRILVVLSLCLWLLQAFGVTGLPVLHLTR